MAPKDWALWFHARCVAQLCPSKLEAAKDAYAMLQETKAILKNSGINFSAPCTGSHGCELPGQLKHWNRVLVPANLQLRERNARGEIAVLCFHSRSDLWEPMHRRERAVLLLHWLLVKHSCVTALQVDDWGVFKWPKHFALFCDCLRACRRLKSLKLCVVHPEQSKYRELLDAISRLRHLEEFSCETLHVVDVCEAEHILWGVALWNAKLNRLAVEKVVGVPRYMGYMMEALADGAFIVDLRLDVGALRARECKIFSLELGQCRSLKSLRLVGSLRKCHLKVALIAKAAEGLTALVDLELAYFRVSVSEACALANSVCLNNTVRRLALLSCMPLFSLLTRKPRLADGDSYRGVHWRVEPFLHMLRKATSLRKLTFPVSGYPKRDRRAFFEALAANDLLEELRVQKPTEKFFSELRRLVRKTGAGSRVKIDAVSVDDKRLENVPEGSDAREVRVLDDETAGAGEMHKWFSELPAFSPLTTLRVDVECVIDAESAGHFAQYLRSTQLLRNVTMSFLVGRDEALVLLDALSHNTSITALVVERWCERRHTARLLADVVCSSKRIRALSYHVASGNPSPVFVSALAKRIERNCTLLSVQALRLRAEAKAWSFVQEVVARNFTLLVQAARCVTACEVEKSAAEALELLSSDPAIASDAMLVSKVQEMAPRDEEQAKDAIASRLADLNDLHFFMRTAGVVKGKVVCEGSAEGRPCLGTLPYKCWQVLRRYLRVADVMDSPARN